MPMEDLYVVDNSSQLCLSDTKMFEIAHHSLNEATHQKNLEIEMPHYIHNDNVEME